MEGTPPGDGRDLPAVQGDRRDLPGDRQGYEGRAQQRPGHRKGAASAAAVLEYEDPQEDHTEELETLRELCLAEDARAVKLWK